MSALGDRRRRVRHEVVGALWGTLEVQEHARVVNISERGALVASSSPKAIDLVQPLQLNLEGHAVQVEARVRHSGQNAGGEHLAGLEFLSIPSALDTSGD